MKKRILSILLALCMLFCLVPTTAFAADCAEDLVDPVIWIHLSSDGGGYYDVLNGTWTAADFFQPGKAPKGAKITAVTPPTSPSIPVSVNVNSDGTLNCTKTENTTEPVPKSETYTVTITSDDYAPISAPLTVRQYLNAGFRGPVYFDDELLYGDTYTYTCRVNNPGENGVWSALIQDPQMFEIYKETTDTTSEPGKSIYTVHIRAIKAGARITCIDFLYVSDTTMASSKVSRGAVTGGAVRTRPLTVTAGSATITEGNALPTDLVTCTGLLNSEGRKDDRDTVLDNALGYQLLDANNEEVTAATARNMPGTYTVVPAATLKSSWGERYSLNKVNGTLTVENQPDEQFTLAPGGRYYFDMSAMNIPGTANGGNSDGAVSLPDTSLHYVPFTYVGTIEAYKLTSATATTEEYAQQNKYPHSLFVADYAVTHTISWGGLNDEGLIFGKNYASGGVDYTLRAPSVGSNSTGSGESQHDTPSNNEWDRILDKNSGYIQNWNKMYSWGQDTSSAAESFRAYRGYNSARFWYYTSSSFRNVYLGFRPVLEVLNPGTLGSDGLKVVTLDLGGGKLGNSSEDIQIIVKTGSEFTAPASDGLTRPDGNTGSYFMWLGSNGKLYAPGASVPADVTELTVQWTAPTYAVTLNTNGGTINNGNVTEYTYGVGATLPTDVTRTGYTFKGWYYNENLTGSPVTAIGGTETGNKEYWAKWEINQYTVTVKPENGEADITITQDYGTPITAPADPIREGYTFIGWDRDIPKTMPAENITVTAQWEINQYTITFDTNGGSEIAPITQDYGTEITAPDNPTRKGYTFKGWDKEIPETMPAENITVTAQWEINRYTITFDTAGGSEIAPITQDYGTNITAPANPTRKGYTFKGWDKEIPETMPAENITVKAQWEINRYTITFDTTGGSEIAPITQDYGTNITAPADPTREGYTFIGWDKAIPTTMPAENITVTAQWKDSEKPTGEIKINENSWKAFLNNITFGLFFKDTQTVTINAADNSGETVTVEYLLSDKELTKAEFDGMTFTAYTAPFGIDPDNEYIIYVRLTDNAGNTDYICSDGIVLDGTSPVITGIEDGKTYCEAQTVTITEKYVDTVTVNGTAVTLDATGSFTLAPADGEQKIVVTDKAGNTAEMTVTVNDGHTFGEWTSNGDGTHTRQCTADGCTEGVETGNCTDEDKNHICDICGNIISNHEDANQDHVCDLCGKVISNHEDADKDHVCDHCGKVISNHEDADNNHICDYCEKVISNHEDADKDHICDLCGKTISNHDDADNNHICDYCGKTISNHEDADKDHICDHCGKVISNHEDANNDHVCELCGKTISNHEDANKDHVCDYCEKVISNHEDADKDHVCDYCGKVITNHIGGKETCRDKAVCEVCGKSYGKLDPKNHTDLKHFPAKAATEDADGNIEYWYCSGCNKYYSDKDGTKEIAKADTVTAKLPKSPPTGDNSNLMLWIALLFISGGVLTGVTVFDKRKRHSVK